MPDTAADLQKAMDAELAGLAPANLAKCMHAYLDEHNMRRRDVAVMYGGRAWTCDFISDKVNPRGTVPFRPSRPEPAGVDVPLSQSAVFKAS